MAKLHLIRRDPDKAYVSDMLWLPKIKIAEKPIKETLQYWDVSKGEAVLRKLWSETRDHLICPREFIRPVQYGSFPFPFIDTTPKRFPKTNIWVKHKPRDDGQKAALEAFVASQAGILNLSCGKGKSFLALKKIEALGCPALIVVHNSFLMSQWLNEAIPNHLELPPGQTIGVIQGQTFDWEHPITVAMIHSLANRVESGTLPPEFYKHFGVVIYDEVHHLSAPVFLQTAPIIQGLRFGLTATSKRLDAMEFIYKYHLGDIFYSDLTHEIVPRIYFQQTPIYIDTRVPEVCNIRGELSIPKLRSFTGENDESNTFRANCIREAVKEGRKLLCVSHSKKQLIKLHEMFPDSGLIVEETPQDQRSAIVKRSQLSFAISSLGFEGLDDDSIDTVFILLPFGSRNSPPNDLQQVMGRAQREKAGKGQPVVVIFDDILVKPFHAQCNIMRTAMKEWDKHVPGMAPLRYTVLKAPHFT